MAYAVTAGQLARRWAKVGPVRGTMSSPQVKERALLDEALVELSGSRPGQPSGPAVQALVEWLLPVVQSRATRVLLAHGRNRVIANLRATVEEYVQMVLAKVFEQEARVLRLWSEDGGLSLRNWVGRFATLRCRDQVRSGKQDPWRHEAAPPEFFRTRLAVKADSSVEALELWQKVREQVLGGQSERGRHMFRLLIEEDRSTVEVAEATGLKDAAIFQWRRRLRLAIQDAWGALSTEEAS